MILEALVTTVDSAGQPHLAPMGPLLRGERTDETLAAFELRPYETSTTGANLIRNRQGVLHIDDDVRLFAQAAIGVCDPFPEVRRALRIDGWILESACRSFEFEVQHIDTSQPRRVLQCRVVHFHRQRDFFGFNRGKHAVLEAAILATRVQFLPGPLIEERWQPLREAVEKTGGPAERAAFDQLTRFVECAAELPHHE